MDVLKINGDDDSEYLTTGKSRSFNGGCKPCIINYNLDLLIDEIIFFIGIAAINAGLEQ